MINLKNLLSVCLLTIFIAINCDAQNRRDSNQLVERVDDMKEFKKILRTKTNVLVLFTKADTSPTVKRLLPIFNDVAAKMYGRATLVLTNCGSEEGRKLCKKLKITPEPAVLKHFNNGEFNKDYDRKETAESITRFLTDPTGELPWEEETNAADVHHVQDAQSWSKLLRKEKLPILGMFYAPWCGYCKRLKPFYSAAAAELKNHAILAGIDVTRVENYVLQQVYNISGFPTLLYFKGGEYQFKFSGDLSSADGIVKWMKNPQAEADTTEEITEKAWADEPSDVVHLTDDSFGPFIAENPSVLVMFYAPWCGHCKHMKPELVQAAKQLKESGIKGVIAAIDATKEKKLGTDFEIKGFPTVKYFQNGKFAWDYNERTADKIVSFMTDPNEPPPPPPPEQPWEEVESAVVHLTTETFKGELKKRKHALVMFYAPWCGHCKKAKPEYTRAAERFSDDQKAMFAALDCTKNMDICQQQDVMGYPTFIYFSYFKTSSPYEGGREEMAFVNFMNSKLGVAETKKPSTQTEKPEAEEWDPAVKLLNPNNFQSTLEKYEKSLVMYYAPWSSSSKKVKEDFVSAAKTAKKTVAFAVVECSSNSEFCQKNGVQSYPTIHMYERSKFQSVFDGERTTAAFVQALEANPTPKPDAKQTKPSSDGWDDAVFQLTPETFSSIEKADRALVMYYAPWCGHCQRAKPAYNEAAKESAADKTRMFCAIDCAEYKDFCRDKGIKGFPTMFLYEKGNYAKTYNGERSKDGFVTFIAQNLSTKEEL